MSDKPHLSHSQLDMLSRCELQWYYRYVEGIKSPPGVALVVGKGTHGGIAKDLERKMSWGALMSGEEVADATADATRREWDRQPLKLEDGDPDVGQAVDIAVGLTALYHREVAPKVEPIAIEQAFIIETPDLPFDIMGVLDVETVPAIRDTKTSKKRPPEQAARRSTQLALYSLRSTLDGTPGKAVVFDYLIKSKSPSYVALEAHPTADDHTALLKRFDLAARAIKGGVFKPANPGDWCCSERFCGYWERCDFGSRKSVSVGLVDPARCTTHVIQRPDEDATQETEVDG